MAPSEGELEAARMALLTREQQAGQTIPLGGAGLILAYPRSAAPTVEPAVTRAVTKVVGQAEGHHVEALKEAIADAQQKMDQGSG